VAKPQDIDGVSFYPQLQGAAGTPREWLYCWYSPRQRVDLSVSEFTFDHHFKLYRSGEFFDLVADPFEQQPIDSTALSDSQKLAHAKLQAALDQFSDARPKRLDRAFVKSRSADKSTTE
jgi:arylsulfatase A